METDLGDLDSELTILSFPGWAAAEATQVSVCGRLTGWRRGVPASSTVSVHALVHGTARLHTEGNL